MSTTTEPASLFMRALQAVGIAAAVIAGWLGITAGVMAAAEPGNAALVFAANHAALLGKLPPHIRLIDAGENTLVLTSDEPGYVRDIYSAGAIVVFPARKNGCVDLRNLSAAGYRAT